MSDRSMPSTGYDTGGTSWWGAMALGAVFVLAGFFVLGNVVLATVVSAIILGIVLLVVGGSEIVQAFYAPRWRGLFLRLLIGALYAIAGAILVYDPLRASVVLTLIFAIALVASGLVRLVQAYQYWEWHGWLLLLSGTFGIIAGLIILANWPLSGLWVLGLLVGIDLIIHGIWWIVLGSKTRNVPGPI